MMTSLILEKWLPISRRNGAVDWIAPHQISDPDVVALAANRPDFNGALVQLLIGLLQTTTPVDDEEDWAELLEQPPSGEILRQWFGTVADAFVLDGDGARFMQDFSMSASEGAECNIDALLIDAAGGSAIDKNTDHFVKRHTINAMCPHCAATALFTLQTNAPAGGAGHRTSLRGGGPLTTLVIETPSRSLWQNLWLNVKPRRLFLQQGGDVQKTSKHFSFPWLADVSQIQANGGETHPLQVHPFHLFWAMPRRIRLDFSDVKTGYCDVCKRHSSQLVHRYVTKPQGLNYKGPWSHPFSPYYESKEGWLAVHPQPGGFGYKNWLAWVLGVTQGKKQIKAASTLSYFFDQRQKYQSSGQFRLWVFGYDMDNMKPRCWYETTFPLYGLEGSDRSTQAIVQAIVSQRIEAAEQAVFYLRKAVKEAWFGDSDMRGDLDFVSKAFWDSTELPFYRQLQALIEQATSEAGIDLDNAEWVTNIGEAWLKVLAAKALQLFDGDIVGAGSISQQDPRRIAAAYHNLQMSLHGKAIKTILRIPVADKPEKPAKAGKKGKPVTDSQNQLSA